MLKAIREMRKRERERERERERAREGEREREVVIVCTTHIEYWLKFMNFVHGISIFTIQEMSSHT